MIDSESIPNQNMVRFIKSIVMLSNMNSPIAINPTPTQVSVDDTAEFMLIIPPAIRAIPTKYAKTAPQILFTSI